MRLNLKEKTIQKLIEKSFSAHSNAQSEWAKNYWYKVWKKLCTKYNRGLH